MKASTSSKKEPSPKLVKTLSIISELKAKNSELKKEVRKKNKRIKVLTSSRNSWKEKHKSKTISIKGLKRQIKRNKKPNRHHYSMSMIHLCIMLRIVGGCSYRCIRRVLEVLQLSLLLRGGKVPCANTIENWVSKMGLYQLEKRSGYKEIKEVSLIMDENLKASNERVMLLISSSSQKTKEGALKHDDVEVIYLGGKKSWKGQGIEEVIRERSEDLGLKVTHILSDEGSKLLKATSLLGVTHLPDISHAVAKCLRNVFKEDESYKAMMKLIGGYASKSVNQELTYLRPPNQRAKARFMNQKPIILWGLTLLSRFEKLNEKEQQFFQDLKLHKSMLETMWQCIQLSEQIIEPLKKKGLNEETLQEVNEKIKQSKQVHISNNLTLNFIELLEKYASQYEVFLEDRQGSYNVSSDVIESLFGKQKNIMSSNPLVGVTILDLELPVHCIDEKEILGFVEHALEDVFITDLTQWRTEHSYGNQALMRKTFFEKRA